MTTPEPKKAAPPTPPKPKRPAFTKPATDWHDRIKAQRAVMDAAIVRREQADAEALAAEGVLVQMQRDAATDLGLLQVDW